MVLGSLSVFATASLTEKSPENTQLVSFTPLEGSRIDDHYGFRVTAPTTWQAGAQFTNVTRVDFEYTGDPDRGQLTVDETDGNNMGSVQTKLNLDCVKSADSIHCQTVMPNGNNLVLSILR